MASLVNPVLEVLPAVEQLSARVWRVLGLNPGLYTLQGTNTYLVGTGSSRILIDAGEANKPEYVSLLQETLSRVKAAIGQVVITHWHHDHLGGLEGVLALCHGFTPLVYKLPLPPERSAGSGPPTEGADTTKSGLYSERLTPLSDGERLETEGATLKVVATPGHTADHMALLLEEEGAVFTGDCVLGQGSAVFEHLGNYLHSLAKIQHLSPSVLYPGHGPVITDARERIQQYIDHREQRETQIMEELRSTTEGLTSYHIVERMYQDVPKRLWPGAESNVKLHLEKLLEEGKVVKTEGEGEMISWVLTENSKSNL